MNAIVAALATLRQQLAEREARVAELEAQLAKKEEPILAKSFNVIRLLYDGEEPNDE